MSPSPTLLLLDFGAVISKTIFETHDHTENVLGLAPGTLTWLGPIDPSTDPLWRDMIADKITERNYWEQRAAEVGALIGEPDWQPSDLLRRAREGMTADAITRPEALALVRAAKQNGNRVGILSNELALFFGDNWRAELPIFEEMDDVIDASFGGPLKPDPLAYQGAVQAFKTTADDIVFVDDQPRNVTGAQDAGLKAVQFDVSRPKASFGQAARLLDIEAQYGRYLHLAERPNETIRSKAS
ncbi:HAD-IA family hydrolase [Yoonia sp. R2331]|uniref:HAD-IA family hydrolase n=1 Tax=Yoonia sp. R2331 TaxID=3237238 RepID=UPI0034E39B81